MSLDPTDLLRRLEPAVRRSGPGPNVQPVPSIAGAGFGDLLTMVASGRIRSDRPVTVGPSAAIDPSPTPEQLGRIAAAADEAEQAGARRAVMLIDGRGLVLDVPARRLEEEALAGGPAITDLDAAVAVPPDPDAGASEAGTDIDADAADADRPAPPPLAFRSAAAALRPPAASPLDVVRAMGPAPPRLP